jgi:hypothetical protein
VGKELWLTDDPFVAEEGGGAAPASLDSGAGRLRPLWLPDRQAQGQCKTSGTTRGRASMWGRARGGWPDRETSGEACSAWSGTGGGGGARERARAHTRSGKAFYRQQAAFAWSSSTKGVWPRAATLYGSAGSAGRAGRVGSGANGVATHGERKPQDDPVCARPQGARPRECAPVREGADLDTEGGGAPRGMAHALGRARHSGWRDVVARRRPYFN